MRGSGLRMYRRLCWKTGGFAGERHLPEVRQVQGQAVEGDRQLWAQARSSTLSVEKVTKIIKLIKSQPASHTLEWLL